MTLSLDMALTIIRTAEASNKQSKNLKTGDAAAIQGATSSYKRFKQKSIKPPAGGSSSAGPTFVGLWRHVQPKGKILESAAYWTITQKFAETQK